MSGLIRFVSVRLDALGKKGILTPDASGYYTVMLGALNINNSAGHYYVAEGAKNLFESSSVLMRRIANGCLYGEADHPTQAPGQSEDDFVDRFMRVAKDRTSHHIKEVILDPNFGAKNPFLKAPNAIGVIGKVKPTGALGDGLLDALNTPEANVCFSVRGFTNNVFKNKVMYRELFDIRTWDWVTEPGISVAEKWISPALENMLDIPITKASINRCCNNTSTLSQEASNAAHEVMNNYSSIILPSVNPIYYDL